VDWLNARYSPGAGGFKHASSVQRILFATSRNPRVCPPFREMINCSMSVSKWDCSGVLADNALLSQLVAESPHQEGLLDKEHAIIRTRYRVQSIRVHQQIDAPRSQFGATSVFQFPDNLRWRLPMCNHHQVGLHGLGRPNQTSKVTGSQLWGTPWADTSRTSR
jgi:hypothetical protein